jgi:AAA15 family ATPase/GTPase
LEAIFIHAGAYNPNLVITINALRGFDKIKLEFGTLSEFPWDSLFRNYDHDLKIELIGENGKNFHRSVSFKAIYKLEELRKISKFIKIVQSESNELSLQSSEVTLEGAKILELESKEDRKVNKYYLILHKKGIQTEPIPPSPPFPGFYQSDRNPAFSKEMAERFGNLEKFGKQDIVLKALQVIEPNLKRLAMLVVADQPVLHGDIGIGRLIPIPLMGGGIVRLANLSILIGNAEGGVVLIDEIENGIHYSIMPKVWESLAETARQFNTQLFATTHSWECIVSAHKSFSNDIYYDFRLHRLEMIKGDIKAITYDRESLDAAVSSGIEVR